MCLVASCNRRLSFGEVADLYDEARPSYPAALVEDVIALSTPARALEVGAGTGKATDLFAARGVAVSAVEPSAEMAAVAARRLAGFPQVTVEQSDFEHWDSGGATFPLIYAAQAWHWIAPETGYAKARSLLAPGGLLAAFWNRPRWESCALRAELVAAYARALGVRSDDDPMDPGSPSRADRWDDWQLGVERTDGLEAPELRSYEWTHVYSSGEYVALLRTHSRTIVLADDRRAALLAEVGRAIDARGGRLELDYVTWLQLARAGSARPPTRR
jgi:SAM-dependent methyltransferase